MRRTSALLLMVACASEPPTHVCQANTLMPAPPASPARPFERAAVIPLRLVDEEYTAAGAQRPRRAPLAMWNASDVMSWLSRGEGQRVYTSPVLLGQEIPHVARLTVTPGDAAWVEVLASPLQVPTEAIVDLRTRRIPLVAGPDGTVQVEVPIATLVGENWGDEKDAPVLARLLVTLPDPAVAPQLSQVSFHRAASERGVSPVVQGIVEADGIRRQGWTIHPGGELEFPVLQQGGPARAAVCGGGTLEVWANGSQVASVRASESWQMHTWEFPESVSLSFRNVGNAPIRLGEARVGAVDRKFPNVLVYMVDTLRADHLGAYSLDPLHRTPTFDRLASQGAVFARAQSTGSWTKPTVPTLLTGRYPMAHGVGLRGYADVLPMHVPMIHEALGAAGWRTGSFSASPLGSTLSGLDRGFDIVVPPAHWRGQLGDLGHPSAQQVGQAVLDWVDSADDEPWMAYVHTLEPHAWRNELFQVGTDARTPYQRAVSAADDGLAELLSALEQRELLDSTLIIVVSDHGESFGLHGVVDHGTSTVQAQTHVPLIFWAPEYLSPSVTTDTVSLADIAPTLLDIVGIDPFASMDGVSLGPYLSGDIGGPARSGAPSVRLRFVSQPDAPAWYSWTKADGQKVTVHGASVVTSDVSVDPCESEQVAGTRSEALELHQWRVNAQKELVPNAASPIGVADTELLRELGYLP